MRWEESRGGGDGRMVDLAVFGGGGVGGGFGFGGRHASDGKVAAGYAFDVVATYVEVGDCV